MILVVFLGIPWELYGVALRVFTAISTKWTVFKVYTLHNGQRHLLQLALSKVPFWLVTVFAYVHAYTTSLFRNIKPSFVREKDSHSTENFTPYSFRIVCGFFNVLHWIFEWWSGGCRTHDLPRGSPTPPQLSHGCLDETPIHRQITDPRSTGSIVIPCWPTYWPSLNWLEKVTRSVVIQDDLFLTL